MAMEKHGEPLPQRFPFDHERLLEEVAADQPGPTYNQTRCLLGRSFCIHRHAGHLHRSRT